MSIMAASGLDSKYKRHTEAESAFASQNEMVMTSGPHMCLISATLLVLCVHNDIDSQTICTKITYSFLMLLFKH